jgi:hypothetical protein
VEAGDEPSSPPTENGTAPAPRKRRRRRKPTESAAVPEATSANDAPVAAEADTSSET